MGVMHEPTAADYAAHNANDALRENRELRKIVENLLARVTALEARMQSAETDLNEIDEILDFDRS